MLAGRSKHCRMVGDEMELVAHHAIESSKLWKHESPFSVLLTASFSDGRSRCMYSSLFWVKLAQAIYA